MEPSYASGTSTTPLLGDTIGDNLDRTIAALSRSRGAGLRPPGPPLHVRAVRRGGRSVRPRADRGRDRGGRPGRDLEPELRRVGARPVRDGEGRDHPGQHQPGLPDVRARLRAQAVGLQDAGGGDGVQDVRLRADGRRRPRRLRGPRAGRVHRPRLGGVHRRRRARVSADELRERQAATQFDDPINIQYTSGTTGFPKGATLSHHNILNNGYFVGSGCRYSEEDRICIPVPYYHCFGMVMGNLGGDVARRVHGHPGAGVRAGRHAPGGAGRELHEPLRRADDVHRRARAPRVRRVRPVVAADRDHGRLAVPDRDDEALRGRDAHGGGDDLLRHDRDLAGVDADRRRRPAGEARRDRGPRAPARRGQGRRPRDAARSSPAASPASCARAATA